MQEQKDLKLSLSFQMHNGFKEYKVTSKSEIDLTSDRSYIEGSELYEVVIVLGTITEVSPNRFTVKVGWGDKQNLLKINGVQNIEIQFLNLDDAVCALVNSALRDGVVGSPNIKVVPLMESVEQTKEFLEQVEKSRKSRHPFVIKGQAE